MSSAYYDRMGWRSNSKYDILPSKSNFSSLRHTYTNDTSPYTNYSSISRKSYGDSRTRDAIKSKSYTLEHVRRKSYGVSHTNSYDTSDRWSQEALRRKSETAQRKVRHYSTVDSKSNFYSTVDNKSNYYSTVDNKSNYSSTADNKSNYSSTVDNKSNYSSTVDNKSNYSSTADNKSNYSSIVDNKSNYSTTTYSNGIGSSIAHKSTVTTEAVAKETVESKCNDSTDMRGSNIKNSDPNSSNTTIKNNSKTDKMLNGNVELCNGVVVHKKAIETKETKSYEELEDSATQAYIDLKKACMNRSKNYSTGSNDNDYNALRKLPEPPSKKSQRDRNKTESKCNVSVENKCNVTVETECNGIKQNGTSEVRHDDGADVINCNGSMESLKESYWKNRFNGGMGQKCSTVNENQCNGIPESKTNCTKENKGNVTMETGSNVTMETKCNVAMEGNIDIDIGNIEKQCNGIAEGRINLVLETKINLVVGRERSGTTEVHCNGIPENKVAAVGRGKNGIMDYIYSGIKGTSTKSNPGDKSKNATENNSNDTMETKTNVAMETKSYVAIETKSNIAMENKSNDGMETKNNVSMETKSTAAMETNTKVAREPQTEGNKENRSNITVETKSNASMETKTKVAMETKSNEAMETKSTVFMETQNNVSVGTNGNVMEYKNIAKEQKYKAGKETNSNVTKETKSNVAMETTCNGTKENYKGSSNKRNSIVGGNKHGPLKNRLHETLPHKINGIAPGGNSDTVYRNQYNRKQGRPLYAERITDFEHNALCLWHSLQRIHQGFLKVFHMHFPSKPGLLYKSLSSHRVKLLQLHQRGLIEQSDWHLLFPEDALTNSSTFDLVLISLLLRTVCEYREPKEGWWKVAAGVETVDTIHFSKIFSVCNELEKCNFSLNDATFEALRKRLERYTTMLGPLANEPLLIDNKDGNQSDEFIQFSAAKGKLKNLEKKQTRIENLLKAIWWKVPCYSGTHVNRKVAMMEAIDERLKLTEPNLNDANDTSVFTLVGPSGIGKTETVRFWAFHFSQQVDGNVIWIDSENLSNIDTAFVKLAKRLGLPLQDKFGKPVILEGLHHHIYDYFSDRKSLFIFDNVKDDSILQQIIPQAKSLYPIILVTSQCKTLRGNIVTHDLEKFGHDDATQLIEQIADHCDERETKKLAEKMNHFPFSLELASYIISKRGITIMDFIKLFDRMTKEESLERDGKGLIDVLVQMFIDGYAYEKNKACIEELLCVCALMHGNKIDLELLLQWDDHTKVNIKAALKEMISYSLIKMTNYRDMNSKKCGFTMHSTIQQAIKKSKLDKVGDKTTFHLNGFLEMYYLRKVLDMIDHYRQYENKLNPSYGDLWAHHIINILHNYKKCNAVMFKMEMFKHDIAIFNIQNRHYQTALNILEIFRRFELSLKVDNQDLLLDTEREYGNCFLMQGNFDAALSVFLKIHAKERHIFENVQEPTLMTRFHIGICLQYLAISERQLTTETDASDLLKPRGTGPMFKKEDEKISAALSVFQDVYNKANKTLHGRHPLVVTAFHHIGICKYYQGDLSTALKIFLKVSEIVLDLDCETRPNNYLMEDQLRRVDERGGEHLSSDLAAFEELYARQKDLLGDSHPISLESKSQIAKCLQEVGSFVPALKHFSEIYAELKNLYGEEHPRSLACREDIGNCLRRTKEFSAAFEIYNDVSKKRVSLLGEMHPHTLDAQYETATCLYYLNDFEAATNLLQNVFERKKKVHGELHTSTLLTKQMYAICLRDSGDTSNASRILQEVYDKYKVVYGENHPTTLSSRQQIGICHLRQLRFTIAYDVLKEVYDKYHALFGEENLRTLTSEYYVSLCLMKLGKFMDALILLRNICDNLDKLIGLDEPIYLDSAHHLGICLQAQGYLWTAINVFQEVYNLRKNQRDSSSTLCSSQRLAMCCLDIGNHFAARYAFTELYDNLSKK